MKNSSRLSIILTGCVLLAVLSLAPPAGAVLTCGPGSHWVDGCTSGIDAFPSVATVGLDLNLDNVKDISVVLAGPTSIYRGDPVDAIIGHPQLGNVGTTDGHMDVIETEIIALTLTGGGITVRAGDGTGNLLNDGPLYSPGALREKPGDPTRALSFFDVFFELDTPFGTLHNIQPLRLESEIDRVPPIGFTYTHAIPNPIGLFDQNNIERARLVDASHTPVPEPSTWLLLGIGVAGLVVLGRRCLGWPGKCKKASPYLLLSIVVSSLFFSIRPAQALHIPQIEVNTLRTPIFSGEGYLSYHLFSPFGEERTGWTDIRHPAMDGTRDNIRGYDWSDNQVAVLTHNVNAPGGNSTVTGDLRRQDFNVANAVYAQAGITVRQESNVTINGNNIVATAGGDVEPSLSTLFGTNRSANTGTVNQYYVDDIPGAEGYALMPQYAASGGAAGPPTVYNNGFSVPDTSRALPDGGSSTFAHELGHYLLDDNRFTTGNTFHSSLADDLMLGNPVDPNPSAAKDINGFGLRDAGRANGNIGTRSHLGENVTNLAGGAAITQIEAMHKSPSVSHTDNGFWYGDKADFDWVEDNIFLEGIPGADNHVALDFMMWGIGPIVSSPHTGHDHDAWGELDLPSFTGPSFRVVDVVSQICRYVDMDVNASGDWSRRESALDYFVQFSMDGASWVSGLLEKIFIPGWTNASSADDYLARWDSPIDARFVRIGAKLLDGHDGNVQIDAIIAATIPEPSTLLLLGAGLAGLMLLGRRRLQRS